MIVHFAARYLRSHVVTGIFAALIAFGLTGFAAPDSAWAQADGRPGTYRIGQTVNAHSLIVCSDKDDALDILDAFKISDAEAEAELKDLEETKIMLESACGRVNGRAALRIADVPAQVAERDGEKVSVVKMETAKGGRTVWAVLFGAYVFERPPEPPKAKSLAETLPGRYTASGVNPNGSTYTGEVTIREANGTYYFNWRVGSDTFRGSGKLRGRTLTINWGQQYPVIYQVGSDGTLRGRWSNGRGSEDLEKSD